MARIRTVDFSEANKNGDVVSLANKRLLKLKARLPKGKRYVL
jgi:hypothetical protein